MNALPLIKVAMPPRELLMPALESVLYSGMIAEGEHVYAFEKAFADHFGLKNVLAMSSGTAALHVAMLLAGVSPGDEVVTTSMTAEPTNTTILQVGAHPIFADVDPETGNLCPISVAARITSRTKAICVVHYAGYPADLNALRRIADEHGIALIEDCAHALGAHYNGVPIGSIGDFAIFSFQAIKHMTTIDGGVLVVKSNEKIDLAKRLRWFGLTKGVARTAVDITTPGFKYNMNNVAAVIGMQQLAGIDSLLTKHIENGRYYDEALAKIPGLKPAVVAANTAPTYWLYTLLADDSTAVENCLAGINVAASKLHRPNHFHSVFKPFPQDLPGLDQFYKKLIHIPCGWWVSAEDRQRITDALSKG